MLYLLCGIFAILCVCILGAGIKNKGDEKKDIFYNAAFYVYKQIKIKCSIKNQHSMLLRVIFEKHQVKSDLIALNPTANEEALKTNYYVEKLKLCFIILFLGNLLAIVLSVSSYGNSTIVGGEYIERKEHGQGDIQTELLAKSKEGEFIKKVKLSIKERGYREQELEQMYNQILVELEKEILGANASLDRITSSMNLPTAISGYPFLLQWESDQLWIINTKGEIQKTEEAGECIGPEGKVVVLSCLFSYRNWEREYCIPICIYPPQLSKQEYWENTLEEKLKLAEAETEYETNFLLPKEVEDGSIRWEEKTSKEELWILIMGVTAACSIFILKDRDLHQKTIEKRTQMEGEYPLLVNRITLYLGAGMTIKNAWIKIALDYRKGKEQEGVSLFLYEEMLFACYEMQSGISEVEAYENFSERCGSIFLTRLTTLLVQSLKKGNAALLSDLQKEAALAQEERRNFARKAGEEAGTKLLVPMMMMLSIVMIFILTPAFQTFGM